MSMKAKLLILNGPNINLLGLREPGLYGNKTLRDLEAEWHAYAHTLSIELLTFQSNHEGELVDRIQQASVEGVTHIVINAAAYTHTSIAIRDALLAVSIPFYEVHITDVSQREDFRQQNFLSDIAKGTFTGLGTDGYLFAMSQIFKDFKN